MTEIWRAIPGFEGLYEVSDHGRVRSLGRRQKNGVWRTGRVLRGAVWGLYRRFSLRDADGRLSVRNGHRLVIEAFRGLPESGQECRHLNGDSLDNRLENLAWGTRERNEMDKPEKRVLSGERHWNARLTEDQVREIKYCGLSQRETARLHGIRQQDVSRIRLGQRWAGV